MLFALNIIMPIVREPRRTVQSVLNDLIARVNTDTRRLRVIEQEMDILKTRMVSMEQATEDRKKSLNTSLSDLNSKIARADDKVARMESMVEEVVKGMKRFASASKIKELEQLIEIYSPLKSSFITREEAEQMIEDKLGEKGK